MDPIEHTLVVGVDYSDFCIPALDEALRLSALSPATRVVPLLALPLATPTRLQAAAASTDVFVARAKDNLLRLTQARARRIGVQPGPILPHVCFGAASDCLIEQARELGATLILVGTHSRQGLQHLLMGSVAEEVVRKAGCSVLVARARPVAPTSAAAERVALEPQPLAAPDDDVRTSVPVSERGIELLSEAHLDAGRVVLHVLDLASGHTFVCSFQDFTSVQVEPIEGAWVPQPSARARARAVQFALAEAARDSARFSRLFAELSRRALAGSSGGEP